MSSELQKMKNKIEKLDKNESIEIFKIIHKNQINYSQNNNGIFIDLSCLNDQSLIEIRAFLDFIEENKKHIHEIENKMKQNKITLDNKFSDNKPNQQKQQTNKYEIILCNDYSPFITELDDNYIDSENILLDNTTNEIIIIEQNIEDDLNEIIDNELDDVDELEEEEETLSASFLNKKKKCQGLQYRILKKCKNINAINGDIDDFEKEYNDEQELKELPMEGEYL
jgi:hypothetical protein